MIVQGMELDFGNITEEKRKYKGHYPFMFPLFRNTNITFISRMSICMCSIIDYMNVNAHVKYKLTYAV